MAITFMKIYELMDFWYNLEMLGSFVYGVRSPYFPTQFDQALLDTAAAAASTTNRVKLISV